MTHSLSRRAALRLALAGLLALPAALPSVSRAEIDRAAVLAPISALNDALVAVMKAGGTAPFSQRFESLSPAVDHAFDLLAILRTSVGPRWGDITADAQSRLLAEFQRFTVASYVANFDSYDGQRIDLLPILRQVGEDQVVQTRLVPRDGAPTALDYVMRDSSGNWRAIDVLLDGSISRVAVQRSDFRSLLGSGGANALLASLQRKITDLSGNTMR